MKNKIENHPPVAFKKGSRFFETFPINLPFEKIDLRQWFITMNDEDYRSYSPAHKALGSYESEGKFYMINVENVGTDLIIQNYELKSASSDRVILYSARSKAFIMRWFPVFVGVPWEFTLTRVSATRSNLTCMIGVDYPNVVLRIAAWFNGLGGLFLKNHLEKKQKLLLWTFRKNFVNGLQSIVQA